MPRPTGTFRFRPLVIALAAGLVAGVAGAEPESSPQAQSPGENGMVLRTSNLIDEEVKNTEGEPLGRIEDIVIDETGEVRFLVLSPEDEERLTAAPWDAVQPMKEGEETTLVLDISKERLTEAPHFTDSEWPDMSAESAWSTRVESHFAAPVSQELAKETPARTDEGVAEFSQLDQDGDGRISEDEAQQSTLLSERFDASDTDGDGSIDDAEFSAFEADVSSPELSPEQEREEEAAEE